ncbi:MAG: ATP-binding protein, partial [Sphingobium sp.]
MPRLVILEGPGLGRRFELAEGTTVVGRHTAAAVSILDARASRRHCELVRTAGTVALRDLSSGNGTILNGHTVERAELRHGDRLQIGDTLFLFATDDTASLPKSPSYKAAHFSLEGESGPHSAILRSIPVDDGSRILQAPEAAGTDWLRRRLANLAVLYEASHAVADILDVDELLGRIVELVVKTTEADQGCAVLVDAETHEFRPTAIRKRPGAPAGELTLSRTVIEHVLEHKRGILVSDAGADERFSGGESIAKYRLREIVCVPMKGRQETVGVLFLDTHAAPNTHTNPSDPVKFTEDHLRLAVAVAHQAAVAVEGQRYYQAMLQAERLAAVGQTIAALSHSIKNIMQGVRFGSDLVRMGLPSLDAELLGKGWKLVEKNQKRIDDLMLDMLSYSKEREAGFEPTDLNGLVSEVVESLRGRAAEKEIELTFVPMTSLPPVPCDPDGLHHALMNVIGNALDAVEGAVHPAVHVAIHGAVLVPIPVVEIVVRDNGSGVPVDRRETIFRPFVSSKGGRGTGLGLPVSRKILREHGGDVIVRDGESGGAEFVLQLPLTPPLR